MILLHQLSQFLYSYHYERLKGETGLMPPAGASMQAKIDGLERTVSALDATMKANHAQNRGDIHRLFNAQESMSLTMREGLDRIADRIGSRCDALDSDIVDLRLKWAKATGYSAGVAGVCALLFELIKFGLEHIK